MSQSWTDLPGQESEGRWLPHALLISMLALCAIALAWSALTDIDEVTRGDARVITQSQTQLIQNLEAASSPRSW